MAEFLADRPQVPAVVAQQKQKLYVAVLLDRSGSMAARKEETIGAFNGYVAGLEKDDAVDARLTLTQFDSTGIDNTPWEAARVSPTMILTPEAYRPELGGYTPLFDALGKSIAAAEEAVRGQGSDVRVVFVVLTDGLENVSREFTLGAVRALVEKKQAEGWLFLWLGADLQAASQAQSMGVGAGHTMSYGQGLAGQSMAAAGRATQSYAATGSLSAGTFTAAERKAAGDQTQETEITAAELRRRLANARKEAQKPTW